MSRKSEEELNSFFQDGRKLPISAWPPQGLSANPLLREYFQKGVTPGFYVEIDGMKKKLDQVSKVLDFSVTDKVEKYESSGSQGWFDTSSLCEVEQPQMITIESIQSPLNVELKALKADSMLRKGKYRLKLAQHFLMTYADRLQKQLKEKIGWSAKQVDDFVQGRKDFDADQILDMEGKFGICIYDILKGR